MRPKFKRPGLFPPLLFRAIHYYALQHFPFSPLNGGRGKLVVRNLFSPTSIVSPPLTVVKKRKKKFPSLPPARCWKTRHCMGGQKGPVLATLFRGKVIKARTNVARLRHRLICLLLIIGISKMVDGFLIKECWYNRLQIVS